MKSSDDASGRRCRSHKRSVTSTFMNDDASDCEFQRSNVARSPAFNLRRSAWGKLFGVIAHFSVGQFA